MCAEFDVPLAAAAIQFSLSHPTVASLIAGFGSPTEVTQFDEWLGTKIPDELWQNMKEAGYIHPDAPTTSLA
jgi:D-threo-aldose 1-dehydrogenase